MMKYLTYIRLQKIKKYLEEYYYGDDIELDLSSFFHQDNLFSIFRKDIKPIVYYYLGDYSITYCYGCIILQRYRIDLVIFYIFKDKFIVYDGTPITDYENIHSYKEINYEISNTSKITEDKKVS